MENSKDKALESNNKPKKDNSLTKKDSKIKKSNSKSKTKNSTSKSKKTGTKKSTSTVKKTTKKNSSSKTKKTETKSSSSKLKKDNNDLINNIDLDVIENDNEKETNNLVIQNTELSDFENRIKKSQKDFSKIYSKENHSNIIQPGNVITASTISKKNNSKIEFKNYIYNIIILICLALIIYSSYNIIKWHKNNVDNNALIEQVTKDTPISEIKTVTLTNDITIEKKSYDFSNLVSQNPDTIGWISVPNTEIDYPIVKGNDNEFYLNHSFDKSYNAAGWIYADYRNKCDDTDSNLIIYGHNRLNNNMFGTLENTLSNDWLNDESNYYINYSSINQSNVYEIFSTVLCSAEESIQYLKTDFSSEDDFIDYISNIKNISSYNFNVSLNKNDKIITLYTCHGLNNERLLVFGKLIEEKTTPTKDLNNNKK